MEKILRFFNCLCNCMDIVIYIVVINVVCDKGLEVIIFF